MTELARRVRELAISESEIIHTPYEKTYGPGFEDMPRRTPNIDKLKKTIGYEPTYRVNDILRDVISYFEKAKEMVTVDENSQAIRKIASHKLHKNGTSKTPLPL